MLTAGVVAVPRGQAPVVDRLAWNARVEDLRQPQRRWIRGPAVARVALRVERERLRSDGSELAQAFCRLGSTVTLFHKNDHILDREDEDAARLMQNVFEREGVRLILRQLVKRYKELGGELRLRAGVKSIVNDGARAVGVVLDNGETIEADRILSSARHPKCPSFAR